LKRLVIIGGSSPFTVPLFEAMAGSVPPFDLILQGRSESELALTVAYAESRLAPLGWRVSGESDRRRALEGGGIVLQQARFGGPQGRLDDERLALSFGIAPDETLGPSALQSILRMRSDLLSLGREIREACPDAHVLNLTNPLSVATSLLRSTGLGSVFGLCELPLETARAAAAIAGAAWHDVHWSYSGLNHRGFVVRLEACGRSVFPAFLERLGNGCFSGATADEIRDLGAIPTKYYALLTGRSPARGGRAAALISLRAQLCDELRRHPSRYPAAAHDRGGTWYELAVAPAVAALCADKPARLVLNCPNDDLLTREVHCELSSRGVRRLPQETAGGSAGALVQRFEEHECAVVRAALEPSRANICDALAHDPLAPPRLVSEIADMLCAVPMAACPA
jgi:6-phospho-beta-glucosidase